MIYDSARLKLDYEPTRLGRYAGVRREAFYSNIDLYAAYENWATPYTGSRQPEWDEYCDVRDLVPKGTNAKIRRERASSLN